MPFAVSIGEYILIQDIFGKTLRSGTLRGETDDNVNAYREFDSGMAYYFADQPDGPYVIDWVHWVEVPKSAKKFLVNKHRPILHVGAINFSLAHDNLNPSNPDLMDAAIRFYLDENPQYDIPDVRHEASVIRNGNRCQAKVAVFWKPGFNFQDPFGVNKQP